MYASPSLSMSSNSRRPASSSSLSSGRTATRPAILPDKGGEAASNFGDVGELIEQFIPRFEEIVDDAPVSSSAAAAAAAGRASGSSRSRSVSSFAIWK